MSRTVKVFASNRERAALREKHDLLAEYDAFVVLNTSPAHVKALAKQFPIEDITDQYRIPLETNEIKTVPRFTAKGMARRAAKGRKAPSKEKHHYIVQFVGPIKQEWIAGLKKVGGEPRQPYEGFTYVVRTNDAGIERIRVLPYVRWVGHLPHNERIERNLNVARGSREETLPRTRALSGAYVVEFFGAKDARAAKQQVAMLGFEIAKSDPNAELLIVRHEGTPAQTKKAIKELSAVHGIRMIRKRTLDRTSNNIATGIMGARSSVANPGLGLDGSGEVIGICDTGLDTGDPNSIHDDFAGRIKLIKSYPITSEIDTYIHNPRADDGPADVDSGHGTHCAGSILGDGTNSTAIAGLPSPIRGLARKAKLVFQAVEQETLWKSAADLKENGRFGLWGIPSDLKDLFKDAYDAKARIHSNSWGGGEPGEYDAQCRQLDQFVWDHKDFCILVAAGNDGTDKDADGKINEMSVTSPATAKNCITIGASENVRPEFAAEKYGDWWPRDYPKAPFKNDSMANDEDQLAAFSSRGPTQDGRIKPDVVAPGTFILSTRSTQIADNNKAWAAFPPSKFYFHMGGTSMATPLAAGAAAIVRQYLRTKQNFTKPSAALIKATLIAGARRLNGFASATAVSDIHQGFGRVNLDEILNPTSPASAKFIHGPAIDTGQEKQFTIAVTSVTGPLRIVLAYSDYPGNKLINNLNLIATDPDGKKFVGNGGTSAVLAMDAKNNVEVIAVSAPKKGNWTLQIIGSNVPKGPQDFALVILGAIV